MTHSMILKYSEILKNPDNIGRNMEPNTLRMFAVWCQFSQDTICHLRGNSICTNICQCCALLPRGNRCPSEQPIDKDGDSSYVFKLPYLLLVNRSINGRVSGIFENDIRKQCVGCFWPWLLLQPWPMTTKLTTTMSDQDDGFWIWSGKSDWLNKFQQVCWQCC